MKRGVTCCDEGGVIIGEAKGGHINGEVVLVRQRQPHLHIMLHKNTGGEAYSRINTRITRGKGQKNKKAMPQSRGVVQRGLQLQHPVDAAAGPWPSHTASAAGLDCNAGPKRLGAAARVTGLIVNQGLRFALGSRIALTNTQKKIKLKRGRAAAGRGSSWLKSLQLDGGRVAHLRHVLLELQVPRLLKQG